MNDNMIMSMRALGSVLAQYCDTTKQVRDYCRAENVNRTKEAFVVEGFKRARMVDGLSENV
jgi:hypothetical protein